MFPVYSVTYVPGPYPVLRSLGLLDVLQRVRLRGPRSQALPGRRLRRLAATRREKCGLNADPDHCGCRLWWTGWP